MCRNQYGRQSMAGIRTLSVGTMFKLMLSICLIVSGILRLPYFNLMTYDDGNHRTIAMGSNPLPSLPIPIITSVPLDSTIGNDNDKGIDGNAILPLLKSDKHTNIAQNFVTHFSPSQQKAFLSSYGSLCTPYLGARQSSVNPVLKLYTFLEDQNDHDEDHGEPEKTNANPNSNNHQISKNQSLRAKEIQQDLWKFCAMGVGYALAYVDFSQAFTHNNTTHSQSNAHVQMNQILQNIFSSGSQKNLAIVHEFSPGRYQNPTSTTGPTPSVVHSAVIQLGRTESGRQVSRDMVRLLLDTDIQSLLSKNNQYAMWKGGELHRLIDHARQTGITKLNGNQQEWMILSNRCAGLHTFGIRNGAVGNIQIHNPSLAGFCSRGGKAPCCQVEDIDSSRDPMDRVLFLTRHSLEDYPYSHQHSHVHDLRIPNDDNNKAELQESFASQVLEPILAAKESTLDRLQMNDNRVLTPSFFDILLENDCLPSQTCHRCLSRQAGGDKASQCNACKSECLCYCEALCKKVKLHQMKIAKEWHIRIPSVKKRADRLIPKIVHQTFFEEVTQEKYPNFSRLVQSWKSSGWEYHFYSDADAEDFISEHFPHEVREAYDALIPGAYKADLFRYCVLLIYGGIYVDVDVLLSTDLDTLLEDDIGFMVPVDEPGRSTGAGSCLWNGLLAAAPGHPIIAKTIELVVNTIRNRYTAVDIDNMLCPTKANHRLPDLDLSHSFDLLYITGPCMLGGALNTVLGEHFQSHITPGEIITWNNSALNNWVPDDKEQPFIEGRTVILAQNKNDMGSHRFTFVEKNMVVATTDMPNYDDRNGVKHYSDSKNEKRHTLFGMKGIFKNSFKVNQIIKLSVIQ